MKTKTKAFRNHLRLFTATSPFKICAVGTPAIDAVLTPLLFLRTTRVSRRAVPSRHAVLGHTSAVKTPSMLIN